MNEYDLNFMLLKDFREPLLLSLEMMHFRNSLCYRIDNNSSFKHKSLNHVGHGDKSHFWSLLGLLKFQDFLSFPIIPKWSYSYNFCRIMLLQQIF